VQNLSTTSMYVVNTVFVLVIITAGLVGMTHGTFQIRYEIKDLVPRLVVGFTMANFGVPICQQVIAVANALTVSMVGQTADGTKTVEFVKDRVKAALSDQATGILAIVIGLIIVILMYTLLVGWFARLAVLIVLAGIAPIALACYSLPQLQGAAQLWWRSLLGCLAVPTLQAICFSSGVNLLLDPNVNVPILLGIGPSPSTDVFNLAIAACLLWLTIRVPKLVGRYVTRSGGQMSTAGVVLRAVAIQSITRRLRISR
jgi:hypothetical protein